MTYAESIEYKTKLAESTKGVTKLSILICTTADRRAMFNILMQEFYRQIEMGGYAGAGVERWEVEIPRIENNEPVLSENGNPIVDIANDSFRHPAVVEIIFEEDNKEMSVGAKRQKLLERANGDYIVFFDSDDFPKPKYVHKIMEALKESPDCVGFKIAMTTNGSNPQTCCHSLKYKQWANNVDGYDFVRNVTHFNPVLKSLALQVGFKDIRFGEDRDYADRLTPLCKTEVFINEPMFDYRYSNKIEHKIKYGIK